MEVRGEDFVKNLEIEREKTKLDERKNYLEKQKEQSVILNSNNIPKEFQNEDIFTKEASLDNELDDIKLASNTNNSQNYIVLGFALLLLFLVTIIIIRLVSTPSEDSSLDNNAFIQNDSQEEIVRKINTDVVNIPETKEINQALNINDIEQNEEIIPQNNLNTHEDIKNEELQNNIFEITKQENTPKEIIKHEDVKAVTTKEPVHVKEIKKVKINPYKEIKLEKKEVFVPKPKKVSANKVNGYYVQVGAFSKKPNNKLLTKLRRANLKYTLFATTINGKRYIKLLVGPYKTYTNAKTKLSKARKISGNSKAYIKRFK